MTFCTVRDECRWFAAQEGRKNSARCPMAALTIPASLYHDHDRKSEATGPGSAGNDAALVAAPRLPAALARNIKETFGNLVVDPIKHAGAKLKPPQSNRAEPYPVGAGPLNMSKAGAAHGAATSSPTQIKADQRPDKKTENRAEQKTEAKRQHKVDLREDVLARREAFEVPSPPVCPISNSPVLIRCLSSQTNGPGPSRASSAASAGRARAP